MRRLHEPAEEDVEGHREMVEVEAEVLQGEELSLKRWNFVVHVELDEGRAEADPSSAIPHWPRFHSSGRHAQRF